jgi:predicted DNA-binding WGR domain protein
MLKLYRRSETELRYHEAWVHGSKITEHWGLAGERGETAMHKCDKHQSESDNLLSVLAKPLSQGYTPPR